MNPQPSLLHAESYISIHASHAGPGYHERPSGPFVTISRESGTGVSDFVNTLASCLDQVVPGEKPWTVFDRNLVEEVLKSRELSPFLASFLPEDRISDIQSGVGEILGLHPSLWDLIRSTNNMMRRLARAGHVILVGRGANFATGEVPHGLHLRLVAPSAYRARHKARELGLSVDDAVVRNARVDAARRKYVQSVFEADVERPQAYDFIINVARLPAEAAADLIAHAVQRHASQLVG